MMDEPHPQKSVDCAGGRPSAEMTQEQLKAEFERAMLDISEAGTQHGYNPHQFKRVIRIKGGWQAAKDWLASGTSDVQYGLNRLWELDLLNESMEALVLQPRFEPLFSASERAIARQRLEDRGWRQPLPDAH